MIPQAYITEWSQQVPWQTNEQVEQDLVICRALVEIFSDEWLAHSLAFRGGTALHKLYLNPQRRYSEDIDLVQVRAEPIKETVQRIQEALTFLGDSAVKPKRDGTQIICRFDSEFPPSIRLRLKVEANTREHFTVLGFKKFPFEVKSSWFEGSCDLTTYCLEELLGTKLRALYQRRKGRDLYDMFIALTQQPDMDVDKLLHCYREYMKFSVDKPPSQRDTKRIAIGIIALSIAGACDNGVSTDAEPEPDAYANPNLPPDWQPWEWNGYEKFPSLYFAAEPEGYFSEEQMEKISQFSLAILEFRMGQFAEELSTGKWAGGDLAGFMDTQVSRFKSAHPNGPPMLVYRNGLWAGSMYQGQWDALQDQSLFIDDARLCDGFISYPMDVDESGFQTDLENCRWDFTNPSTQEVFTDLMDLASKEHSDGVFFDNAQSFPCDESGEYSSLTKQERASFMEAQTEVYARVFSGLVNNGKYPILSTTNGFSDIGAQVPWESDCPMPEEHTIEALSGIPFARNNEFWMWNLGELASKQIRNTIKESQNGVPIILHMPYFPDDGGCLEGCRRVDGTVKSFTETEFLEFGIATFLVSMGPGSYFGFSNMQNDPELSGW